MVEIVHRTAVISTLQEFAYNTNDAQKTPQIFMGKFSLTKMRLK